MDAKQVLNERYHLLDRAGSGGMATVYRAQDLALGRVVALKVLLPEFAGDPAFLERFLSEAHAAANLAHPNIVTVHDVGADGNRHFIVMEYVEGRTLKRFIRDHLLEKGRPLPVNRALNLAAQVCAGIGYAHRAGLVHCDVKPHNVIVTSDERVKVTDFGIARAWSPSQQTQLIKEQVWGTPQYFAPEQALGQAATPASDVYAIGVMLYEMLTGRTPFQTRDLAEMARLQVTAVPPAITDINPAIPPQLAEIIHKVLAKEPAGRYRTADQLGRILLAYQTNSLEDTGPQPRLQPTPEMRTQYYVAPTPPEVAPDADTGRRQRYRPEDEKEGATQRNDEAETTSRQGLQPVYIPAPTSQIDTTAVFLGLLAIVAMLGLIPLWYIVYQAWLP